MSWASGKVFPVAVGQVVDDETRQWAMELQNAIKEMEKARKEAAEMERTGAVESPLPSRLI